MSQRQDWSTPVVFSKMSDRQIYKRPRVPLRDALGLFAFVLYVIAVLQLTALIHVHLNPKATLLVLAPTDEPRAP